MDIYKGKENEKKHVKSDSLQPPQHHLYGFGARNGNVTLVYFGKLICQGS